MNSAILMLCLFRCCENEKQYLSTFHEEAALRNTFCWACLSPDAP